MSFSKAGAAEDGMEMLEAPLASGSSSVRSSTICVSTSFEFAEILMVLARNRVNLGVEKAAQSFETGQWRKEEGIMAFILLRLFTVWSSIRKTEEGNRAWRGDKEFVDADRHGCSFDKNDVVLEVKHLQIS